MRPLMELRCALAGLAAVLTVTPSAGLDASRGPDAALPASDLAFLRDMTRDVIAASGVEPGSNGGGTWGITNSCGFTLITPGKDTYKAFWVRDFSMALDSGLISPAAISNHLVLICGVQNGPKELQLARGLHVPPWAIPDHINYDGAAVWFPGTYSSGEDQGAGACGRLPPIDDQYEFVHIAYVLSHVTGDTRFLRCELGGLPVFERLERAFASPESDSASGLAQTTEGDRAVGFGFCDAEVMTGKLLFASLLRYRAAGEMAQLARSLGREDRAANYLAAQKRIRATIPATFGDSQRVEGWLRASTAISREPDVWGTLYALHLGILRGRARSAALETIAKAVKAGTIAFEGAVRHVPANFDFSATTAWERSLSPVNTYQNGAYWHTASGWLVEALWSEDRALALHVFEEMIAHLRSQDFRKGPGHGAPWEAFGRGATAPQNPVYLASVALPYAVFASLERR